MSLYDELCDLARDFPHIPRMELLCAPDVFARLLEESEHHDLAYHPLYGTADVTVRGDFPAGRWEFYKDQQLAGISLGDI